MLTQASQMKAKLERDADVRFEKVDTLRHVSYSGTTEIVRARTLSECIWKTAKELGE